MCSTLFYGRVCRQGTRFTCFLCIELVPLTGAAALASVSVPAYGDLHSSMLPLKSQSVFSSRFVLRAMTTMMLWLCTRWRRGIVTTPTTFSCWPSAPWSTTGRPQWSEGRPWTYRWWRRTSASWSRALEPAQSTHSTCLAKVSSLTVTPEALYNKIVIDLCDCA